MSHKEEPGPASSSQATIEEAPHLVRLPDSYVPPIVSILPQIARNEAGFDELAKASGTSLSKAFEKSIHAAFTILGYDAKLLGQGMGRVPDGLAVEPDLPMRFSGMRRFEKTATAWERTTEQFGSTSIPKAVT